jgi:hypothetical protein
VSKMKVTHLDFQVIWEDWNSFELEDNLILKLKVAVHRIVEQEGATHTGNNQRYRIDFDLLQKVQGDIDLHEPSENMQVSPRDIVKDVQFKSLEERVQIYYISKYKEVFLVKPFIKKVSSTSKYDIYGYPIFIVDSGVMMTSVRIP